MLQTAVVDVAINPIAGVMANEYVVVLVAVLRVCADDHSSKAFTSTYVAKGLDQDRSL